MFLPVGIVTPPLLLLMTVEQGRSVDLEPVLHQVDPLPHLLPVLPWEALVSITVMIVMEQGMVPVVQVSSVVSSSLNHPLPVKIMQGSVSQVVIPVTHQLSFPMIVQ